MELKIGLKYTCENNGPDWYGEIISINNGIVTVQFHENNQITGTGSDPVERIINYFETGYFKVKDDFVLPEKWYFKGYTDSDKYDSKLERQKLIEWEYFNKNFDLDCSFIKNYYYCYNGEFTTVRPDLVNYTEITLQQFKQYVLKEKIKPINYTKLINMLKYINERNRTLI